MDSQSRFRKLNFSDGNLIPETDFWRPGAGFHNPDSENQVLGRESDPGNEFFASGRWIPQSRRRKSSFSDGYLIPETDFWRPGGGFPNPDSENLVFRTVI